MLGKDLFAAFSQDRKEIKENKRGIIILQLLVKVTLKHICNTLLQ